MFKTISFSLLLFLAGCSAPSVSPSSSGKIPVTLRAVITGVDGNLYPASSAKFSISPYKLADAKNRAIELNKPGAYPTLKSKPTKEDQSAYEKAMQQWEIVAYKNLSEVQQQLSNGRASAIVTTDTNGEGKTELESGRWYVNGSAIQPASQRGEMSWFEIPVDVNSSNNTINLTNSNGKTPAQLLEEASR